MKKIEFIKKDSIEINNILKTLLDEEYKIEDDEEYKYYLENSKILKDYNIYYFLYFSVNKEKQETLKKEYKFFKEIIKEEIKVIIDDIERNIKEFNKENRYKLNKEQLIEFKKSLKKLEKKESNLEEDEIKDKNLKELYEFNYLINIITTSFFYF